ncbi:hypothetical protein RAS2_28450 [Phycisphaerae bacterium RAS2]|nr:hypothetical protein RAS2_28450 [Phycisphaerae bacterium RAS2]
MALQSARQLVVLAAFWLVSTQAVFAQPSNTPRPEFWVTDGPVHALAEHCGTLYIGGAFNYVGPPTGGAAVLSMDTGRPQLPFPRLEVGSVDAVASDGEGGWYLGGNFTLVNGAAHARLVHVRADHSVDPLWMHNPNAQVTAIKVAGDRVYVGGAFQNIGGQSRNRLAAIDKASGALLDWNPNVSSAASFVYCIEVSADLQTIYIGGTFQMVDGASRNRIAALNAGATTAGTYVKPWNPNAGGAVRAMKLAGTTLYVGGDFLTMGVATRRRIAAVDTLQDTNNVTPWDPNATSGSVRALDVAGNIVYAGGSFTVIGGQTRNGLAALDATQNVNNATQWFPNPSPAGSIYSLAASGNTVYVGGDFTSIGSASRSRIAALDAKTNTNNATGWNPDANDRVNTISTSGAQVCAAGDFITIGRLRRNNLAAIDIATGIATGWNPNVNSVVRALVTSQDTVYAGGDFSQVGMLPRSRIAAINASDGLATNWMPNANGSVYALALEGAILYVGGTFNGSNSIGGQNRNRIAAIDISSGLAIPAWNPNADSWVVALRVDSGVVYAGGSFIQIGGSSRNRIAGLNTINGQSTNWDPNANSTVLAIESVGNVVYVGGAFNGANSIGGQTRNNIAAINTGNNLATGWNPNADTIVRAVAISGNIVYVGGDFSGNNSIGGAARNRLAAIDRNSDTDNALPWNPDANDAVNALLVTKNIVIAGGSFTTIGGLPRQGLAAFSTTNIDWNGGNGLWNVEANWNPPEVPDNVNCETYDVRVAGATSSVLVNINPTINSLTLENGAAVNVDAGSLTFVTPVGVVNGGSVNVTNGFEIIAGSPMKIGGTMPVTLATGGLASNDPANVITLTTPVTGHGQITAALNNQSTIHANSPSQTLDISGSLSAFSDGVIQASNSGTLQINRSIGGAGSYVATDGTISIPGNGPTTVTGNSVNVHSGGQVGASGEALLDIIGHVTLDCNEGALLGCSPPILVMGGDSTLDIGGDLNLLGTVDVNIGSSTFVRLARHFNNLATSPATFRWESGRLSMDGIGVQTFELAGFDFGDSDPNGFTNNFAMGELRIEAGRTVHFVNAFDNIPGPGCEVLYVDSLFLGAGSTIVLNGCSVYYRRLADDGATITLLGGAELTSALIGDMTCDNEVNGGDIAAFILAITDPVGYEAAYPDCPINHADLNQSETVDLADVQGFVTLLLNGI